MFVMSGGGKSVADIPSSATILLLSGSSTTVEDLSKNHKVYQSASPVLLATDITKFNSRSLYASGGRYFTLGPASSSSEAVCPALDLGTSDFTFETWLNIHTLSSSSSVLFSGCANMGYGRYGLNVSLYANTIYFAANSSTSPSSEIVSSSAITFNTWTHWAMTRLGTSLRLYKNGALVDTRTIPSSHSCVSDGIPYVGCAFYSSYSYPLDAHFDDLRIIKGYARQITLPTGPASLNEPLFKALV